VKRCFAILLVLLVAAILVAPSVDLDPTIVARGESAVLLLAATGFLLATALRFIPAPATSSGLVTIGVEKGLITIPRLSLVQLTCRLRR
jgi:hypothetical protein